MNTEQELYRQVELSELLQRSPVLFSESSEELNKDFEM